MRIYKANEVEVEMDSAITNRFVEVKKTFIITHEDKNELVTNWIINLNKYSDCWDYEVYDDTYGLLTLKYTNKI